MKNAMKKLMSLLLVAVLMVSAIPFQASADEVDNGTHEFTLVYGGFTDVLPDPNDDRSLTKDEVIDWAECEESELDAVSGLTFPIDLTTVKSLTINIDNGTFSKTDVPTTEEDKKNDSSVDLITPEDEHNPEFTLIHMVNGKKNWTDKVDAGELTYGDLKLMYFGTEEDYEYTMSSKAYPNGFYDNDEIPSGDTVIIRVTTDYKDTDLNDGANSGGGNKNDGVGEIGGGSSNNNGSNNNGSNNNGSGNNDGDNEVLDDGTLWLGYEDKVNKDPYAVKLRVYLKGKMSTLSSSHTITNSLAKDSRVTMEEIQEFIKTKYKAKDSDGIQYDGIYLWEGNWVGDWAYDNARYDAIDNINVARKYKEINLVVVLDNATLRSSGTADTSNPKTGDSIGMVMTTMGLSAAALAVLFLNKKRAIQ